MKECKDCVFHILGQCELNYGDDCLCYETYDDWDNGDNMVLAMRG